MWYSDFTSILKLKTTQFLSSVVFCLILVAFFYLGVKFALGSYLDRTDMGLGYVFIYIFVLPVYVVVSGGVVLQAMVFVRRNWNQQLGPWRASLVVSAVAGALATFGLLRLQVNVKPTAADWWIGHFWVQWLFVSLPWFFAGWITLRLWPFEEEKKHAGSILVDFP